MARTHGNTQQEGKTKLLKPSIAVNALGVITGSFFDQDGVVHGFVRIQ